MEIPARRELRNSMDHLAVTPWEMQPHGSIMGITLFLEYAAAPCDLFRAKLFHRGGNDDCERRNHFILIADFSRIV